ncbi:MAG: hypothetical protein ACFFAV_17715 [Candidatus Hermodarchaeota archaeon]
MEIINMLGEKLSLKINISPPAVRGLLKLAIKDEIGPFKPLNQLNYEDFKKSIENALKIRLEKLDIKNSKKIIDILINELRKIQSIITIGGV